MLQHIYAASSAFTGCNSRADAILAVNESGLISVSHSTIAHTLAKPRAVGNHFTDCFAIEQARVEAIMERLLADLEHSKARFINLGLDSDTPL